MKNFHSGLKTLYLVLALFLTFNSYSQGTSVTGKVTSADDGFGLPGVNVIVKGTTNGTVTDFDGNYSINVSDANATLVFSYIGFTTQEIPLNGKTVINATMTEDATALDEVVLVGYGTQIKRQVTGSVQTVDVEELADIPVTQVTQKLQGNWPGFKSIKQRVSPVRESMCVLGGNCLFPEVAIRYML